MNINIEEIVKIPSFSIKQNFDKIVSFLSIDFDYDRTLFENDNGYRSETFQKVIEQVTNSKDDRTKLSLLYSLRGFFENFKYYTYDESNACKAITNLIDSFNDKALISQITEYLDDEKQIDNMSIMLEKYILSKRQELSQEEINEIEENIIPEIDNRKQIFLSKKEQEQKDKRIKEKDEEIITNLDDFKSKEYEKMPSWEVAYQIRDLSSDNLKISAMETYFNEACSKIRDDNAHIPTFRILMTNELAGVAEVVSSMNSDENKKIVMDKYLNKTLDFYKELYASFGEEIGEFYLSEFNKYKFRCILSLDDKNEELAKLHQSEEFENYLEFERNFYKSKFGYVNVYEVAKEVLELNSDNEKYEALKSGDIRKAIIAHSDELITIQNGLMSAKDIICSMNSDEMKLKAYEEIFNSIYEYDINNFKGNPDMKSEIEEFYAKNSLYIISSLEDKNLMIDKLIEFEKLEDFLKYGYNIENKGEIIQNNIETILKYYEIDDITEKKEMLLRMKESNSKVFELMDYRLLGDKFLSTFSENEINLIINTPRTTIEEICKYDENELKFISSIIRNLERKDDFNEYFVEITNNLSSYNELVADLDIDSLSEEERQKLKTVIQYKNIFDIKTIDDLKNFESIKNKKLQEIIDAEIKEPEGNCTINVTKCDMIKEKKDAVLLKMFGIDYDTAKELLIEFKEQIVNDKNLQMMNNIILLDDTYPTGMYETDKFLREMYADERIQQTEVPLQDKIDIRKKYIMQYEQMYNDVLFKPKDGELIEEKDGVKFYDAGTDFSILSTSIAAYSGTSDRVDVEVNEKEMWCRKDLSSNHFCGSFSRDDMIGIIQTNLGVYYGFSKIAPGSLLYMSAEDNQSRSTSLESSINGKRPFRTPDNMIEHTGSNEYYRRDLYNEFDIKREIDGVKQEPDYIIAIKVDGRVVNENQALKAAKEWDNEKPIVMVDVDRCLEKSIETLNQSIQEYDQNPTNENLKNVWNTFHKTSITYGAFYKLHNREEHKDFWEMVNLPDSLRDNIALDELKSYYYLKDKDMFGKDEQLTQEKSILEIKKLMDETYGSKSQFDISEENVYIESTQDILDTPNITEENESLETKPEIKEETLDSLEKNNKTGISISKMIKNGVKKILNKFIKSKNDMSSKNLLGPTVDLNEGNNDRFFDELQELTYNESFNNSVQLESEINDRKITREEDKVI